MGVSARSRAFTVLALLVFSLLLSTPPARAGDALVLNQQLPTLRSLVARTHVQSAAATATVSEPICDVFANGFDDVGATVCAGCFDATLDFDETDVDCGSVYCYACADGKHCAVGSDCSSTVCNTATTVCAPATCANGIQDGAETAVDCGGGICPACGNGKACSADTDCLSNACNLVSNTCVASKCLDQRKDGSETGIDCGGGTCPACGVGIGCIADTDCLSNACDFITSTCVANKCLDQRKDGSETDIDCGGGTCAACANGKACIANSDCSSNACDANSNTCVTSQCIDHHKDGAETGVDCGGGACLACANGQGCSINSDCVSNACDRLSNLCIANQCLDHFQDGNETDVDCGGADACSRCSVGQKCQVNADCALGHTCSISLPHVCQ